jgi:hypothetical protein
MYFTARGIEAILARIETKLLGETPEAAQPCARDAKSKAINAQAKIYADRRCPTLGDAFSFCRDLPAFSRVSPLPVRSP